MADAHVAVDARNTLGESPVWCDRRRVLYWTDIAESRLWRLDPASGAARSWPMPERVAAIALCEDEDWLLLALASTLAFWRSDGGALRTLHAIEPDLDTRANDGACDRAGRFVFGTMHEPAAGPQRAVGAFWRLGTGLDLQPLALPRVAIANGTAFSPDGTRMWFCDSRERAIRTCDYGDACGPSRIFARLPGQDGQPDGATVDADGGLWSAQFGLGRVVRYDPDGAVDRVVHVPASQPTRPAFGGEALATLYVTSAREGLDAGALGREPGAGALFACRTPGHRGLPEARFAGDPAAAR